jgi:hypothetical protein
MRDGLDKFQEVLLGVERNVSRGKGRTTGEFCNFFWLVDELEFRQI